MGAGVVVAGATAAGRRAMAVSEGQVAAAMGGSRASIASWVRRVARERGVVFRSRPSDVFAEAVARLSEADVTFDETEQLLLALERARVITAGQRGRLQVAYLR